MPEELAKSVLVPHILRRYRRSLAMTSLPTSSHVLLRRCRKNFDCLTGMHLHPVLNKYKFSLTHLDWWLADHRPLRLGLPFRVQGSGFSLGLA